MKTLTILLCTILFSCISKDNSSIIGKSFTSHTQIKALKDYTKVRDTSFHYNNKKGYTDYGLLELKNKKNTLIIFSSLESNQEYHRIYTILDTLSINSKKNDYFSVGACKENNIYKEQIISLIDSKIDTDTAFLKNIKKAWSANINTNKIETINDISTIECINEID